MSIPVCQLKARRSILQHLDVGFLFFLVGDKSNRRHSFSVACSTSGAFVPHNRSYTDVNGMAFSKVANLEAGSVEQMRR
jgi:hypothetical protein